MFARPEEELSKMILLYNYGKYSAAGVVRFSVFVKVAGGDTAVMNVVEPHSVKPTGKPKENTARQKKGRKLIVRLKISAGSD